MTQWYIGQKVVCVRGAWNEDGIGPSVGDICTISGFDDEELYGINLWFYLDEWDHLEWVFAASSFKPLVSDSPSIEVFQTLLQNLPADERELVGALK